jgi:polyisoprenoid-binding protein YceI
VTSALSLWLVISGAAWAGSALSGTPKVSFFATGKPGFLSIEGKTKTVSLTDDGTNLIFTVPIATVDTGIALRDEHMRDTYVQAAQFPDLVLSVPKAGLTWPTPGGERTTGTVTAAFTTHGVTKQVPVTYQIDPSKSGVTVKASFPFNVTEHNIEIPTYLGVTILPDMRAEVVLGLVDAP